MFITCGLLVAVSSLTVSMNVNWPLVVGAVNFGLIILESVSVTGYPAVWIQEYVIMSPSTSLLWEPSRDTIESSFTLWSIPAFATGMSGLELMDIFKVNSSELFFPSDSFIDIVSKPKKSFVGVSLSEFVPDTVRYAGDLTTTKDNASKSLLIILISFRLLLLTLQFIEVTIPLEHWLTMGIVAIESSSSDIDCIVMSSSVIGSSVGVIT